MTHSLVYCISFKDIFNTIENKDVTQDKLFLCIVPSDILKR